MTDNIGAGLSFWISGTDKLRYLIIPHFRIYFGPKNNNLFIELNTAILKGLSRDKMGDGMLILDADRKVIKALGIGGAIGYKFILVMDLLWRLIWVGVNQYKRTMII